MATVFTVAVFRARSLLRFDRFLPVLLNNNNIKKSIKNSSISQYCSTSNNVAKKTEDLNDTDRSKKSAKKVEDIKVTLLLPDDNLMVTDLENAKKISKRRGLILIKVEDIQTKTGRPLYKLINQTELIKQELDDNENEEDNVVKSIKNIQISSKITIHDLNVKLKNIVKLLEKKHKVKMIIAHGSSIQDKVLKSIEASVKNHGTIQKNVKSMSTVLTIMPILNAQDNTESDDVKNKTR